MSRRLEPHCKQCRREGEKLNLKGEKCIGAKCPMIKRAFKPGQHGPTSRTRPTPYGIQLREKQKAKETYGMQEKQFRLTFEKAKAAVGDTTTLFVQMLEMRLDNVVYKLGFGRSRSLSRQIVNHGHIMVNGKKVNIPSCQVKAGDIVTMAPSSSKSKLLEKDVERIAKVTPPNWLHLEAKEMKGKVLGKPEGEALRLNFNPKLIVEFYSR